MRVSECECLKQMVINGSLNILQQDSIQLKYLMHGASKILVKHEKIFVKHPELIILFRHNKE